jgi:hypothetical protein
LAQKSRRGPAPGRHKKEFVMSADMSGSEQRRGYRRVFLAGVIIAFVLAIGVIAVPPLVSTFFNDDGTGSPGNPERLQPVPRTR